MSDLSMFFAENVSTEVVEEIVVSERFKDKDGNPAKWKIRAITESENDKIRKSCIRQPKNKKKQQMPEFDPNEYRIKLAVNCVVYPDLKNKELQDSYKVIGAENLLTAMLFSGEAGDLYEKIYEINGFDKEVDEMADEIKNE
ncbi:phage portal protein [Brevibacterium sp. JNUCC-42]|nr:phage portal protein [Brevibacterium sp. JNUCC-42]